MALPEVKYRDKVDVKFHNHDKMPADSEEYPLRFTKIYASARRHDDSLIYNEVALFIIGGGDALVSAVNKSSITFGLISDDGDACAIRVERQFIKSLRVVSRYFNLQLPGDMEIMIPNNDKREVEVWVNDSPEYTFAPKDIRIFLRHAKKHYYDKRAKEKVKAKPKAPKILKAGMKLTSKNFKDGMRMNITSIDWDKSGDNLNSLELMLVYKGGFKNAQGLINTFGDIFLIDPDTKARAPIRSSLVSAIRLAADWTSPPPPITSVPFGHEEWGAPLGNVDLEDEGVFFYERGIAVGCKSISLATVKDLYKSLCKVYGKPK